MDALGGGGSRKGEITVDGGTYKIYTNTRVNQPSIHGTATFKKYFSVRQTACQCGRISVSGHFDEWARLGMPLGKMASCSIKMEAGEGVGSIDCTYATTTVD